MPSSAVQPPASLKTDSLPSGAQQPDSRQQWQTSPGKLLPGITLACAVAVLALSGADWLRSALPTMPFSAIMLAILLGMVISNTARLDAAFEPGLKFCLGAILQLGIVLLGIRLSVAEFAVLGVSSLPLIAVCITSAILLVGVFGRRIGLSTKLSTLIAVGTSICGATAIVTTAPIIQARTHEVGYAIACITLFGMVAVLLYPVGAHWLFDANPERIGLFLGTAIHDTAQVVGAGMVYETTYGETTALDTATVTKLMRNLSMLLVIPALAIAFGRETTAGSQRLRWTRLVPLFIVGFALMSVLRTVGDLSPTPFGLLTAAEWNGTVAFFKQGAEFCLLIAMAAVGLNTSLSGMRTVGIRPLFVGLLAALLVGLISASLIFLFY